MGPQPAKGDCGPVEGGKGGPAAVLTYLALYTVYDCRLTLDPLHRSLVASPMRAANSFPCRPTALPVRPWRLVLSISPCTLSISKNLFDRVSLTTKRCDKLCKAA